MKIMIVSDTHKHHKNLQLALDRMGKIDLMIHLGDAEGYEDYIQEMAGCPLEIISGNNDFNSLDSSFFDPLSTTIIKILSSLLFILSIHSLVSEKPL